VNGQDFSNQQQIVANPPTISLPPESILIMYDPDAPNPPYLHWVLVNGIPVVPYQGPSPPKGKKHRYIFELYSNPNRVVLPQAKGGSNFQKNTFVKGLVPIGQTQFTFQSI
jgi:phosphatidylethanolamine-binding protein (PEBP) family uncharacterized protein